MLTGTDITVSVGDRHLLQGISLSVAPGETVALIGENGAGKSTLLSVLCGDRLPSAGSVAINGRPLRSMRPGERARARALLAQEQHDLPGYTALEVVLIGRYAHIACVPSRADRDIAQAALANVDASHFATRLMQTLSGGERARVHLARTLAQLMGADHDVGRYLLLDEPTASLDVAHQHLIMDRVRGFAAEHRIGVVAVLHDFNLAARYVDRLLCLKQGRALALGGPEAVLTEPLLSDAFGMRCTVMSQLPGGRPLVVVLGSGLETV